MCHIFKMMLLKTYREKGQNTHFDKSFIIANHLMILALIFNSHTLYTYIL